MDKSWIQLKNKRDPAYEKRVQDFLDFAYSNNEPTGKISCPCLNCNNFLDHTREVVQKHLKTYRFVKSYINWSRHGEGLDSDMNYDQFVDNNFQATEKIGDMQEMIDDIARTRFGENWHAVHDFWDNTPSTFEDGHEDVDNFLKLLQDAEQELYPGCMNFSTLSFIVGLVHLKTMNNWSCKSFDMLLELFVKVLPLGAKVPKNYYDRDMGFSYEKIHACVNDCVLFRNEYKDLNECRNPMCKAPRYKSDGSKVPQKFFRYFPLKLRLQRLYANKEIACEMRWHKDDDNIMRHPADSEAWKEFDKKLEDFAQDPRNIRFGLSSDGFNPFGNLSNSYSIWPVILVPYNLPPWKCMKDPFLLLSMLIPGPKSPGDDIDVYLQPLVEELKDLWKNGIQI